MGTVTVTLTADEAKALRAMERVVAAQRELGRAGREAGRETASAFAEAEAQLTKVVEGFTAAGVGRMVFSAVKQEVDGLRESLKQLNQETAQTARGEGAAFKNLAQLGGENYGAAVSLAKKIKDQGGLGDQESQRAVFGLQRAGLLNSSGAEVAIRAAKLGLGPDAVERAAQVERGLGREVSAESVERLLKHAVDVAPGQVDETLTAVTREAGQAKALGISEEELLVAQGLASKRSASPERAARGMHQLLEGLSKRKIAGGSLAEKLANAKRQGWSAKVLGEFYGTEGSELLGSLDPDAIRSGVSGFGAEDSLGTAVDTMRGDSSVGAYLDERESKARRDRQLEGRGVAQLRREAIRNSFKNEMSKRGFSEGQINAQVDKLDSSSLFGLGDYLGEGHPEGFGDPEKSEALRGFVTQNWNNLGDAALGNNGNGKTRGGNDAAIAEILREIARNTREAGKRPMADPNRDK